MEVGDSEDQVLPSDLGQAVSWHGLKSQLPVKAFEPCQASRQKLGWRKKISESTSSI